MNIYQKKYKRELFNNLLLHFIFWWSVLFFTVDFEVSWSKTSLSLILGCLNGVRIPEQWHGPHAALSISHAAQVKGDREMCLPASKVAYNRSH